MSLPLTLWIDSANNKLAAGWNSYVFAKNPHFVQGSEYELVVRPIKRPYSSSSYMEEAVIGDGVLSVLIGNRAAKPTHGKWYISFDGDNSELLDYDISAGDLENALNSVPSIVTQGGVSVQQVYQDGYKVIFESEGAQEAIVGHGDGLTPVSSVEVYTVNSGSANERATFWLQLRQLPVSEEIGAWATEQQATASVVQIAPSIWEIHISSSPRDGSFILESDVREDYEMSVHSSPERLEEALGAGFTVDRIGDFSWRVAKDDGSAFSLSIGESEIVSFQGKVNTIKIDGGLAAEVLSGQTETTLVLQVTLTKDGLTKTILQTPCTLASAIKT